MVLCGDDLKSQEINKLSYYFVDTGDEQEALKSVNKSNQPHFLAGFDEFLLGYKDRTATLEL